MLYSIFRCRFKLALIHNLEVKSMMFHIGNIQSKKSQLNNIITISIANKISTHILRKILFTVLNIYLVENNYKTISLSQNMLTTE